MVKLTTAKPKTRLAMLLFAAPGSGPSDLALAFHDPVIVDAHGTLDSSIDLPAARILRTSQAAPILDLINHVASGKIKANTFVIHGLSRVQDEIQGTAPESNNRYYAAVRRRLTQITDAALALPMSVIFTTRSKDEYAKAGDIVCGSMIGPDDTVATGTAPDIDREVPYDVDLVMEILAKPDGGFDARVTASRVAGITIGMLIENPTPDGILALAKLAPPAPVDHTAPSDDASAKADESGKAEHADKAKPIDYLTITEAHAGYGSTEHLKALAAALNQKNVGKMEPMAVVGYLKAWNVLPEGATRLDSTTRKSAVTAFLAALQISNSVIPSDQAEVADAPTNAELTELFKARNEAVTPPFKGIMMYFRAVLEREVRTSNDLKPEDRLAIKARLEAEIATGVSQARVEDAPSVTAQSAIQQAEQIVAEATPAPVDTADAAPAETTIVRAEDIVAATDLTPEQEKLMVATIDGLRKLPPKMSTKIATELFQRVGTTTLGFLEIPFVQNRITKALRAIKTHQSERAKPQPAAA